MQTCFNSIQRTVINGKNNGICLIYMEKKWVRGIRSITNRIIQKNSREQPKEIFIEKGTAMCKRLVKNKNKRFFI